MVSSVQTLQLNCTFILVLLFKSGYKKCISWTRLLVAFFMLVLQRPTFGIIPGKFVVPGTTQSPLQFISFQLKYAFISIQPCAFLILFYLVLKPTGAFHGIVRTSAFSQAFFHSSFLRTANIPVQKLRTMGWGSGAKFYSLRSMSRKGIFLRRKPLETAEKEKVGRDFFFENET